jgi:XTP/dITP diphosphohydrolase
MECVKRKEILMQRQLLVATHNQGKVKEFAEMLADLEIEWLSLDEVGVTEDVAETGITFRENALLKARAYAAATGLLTLADDSGLEVDALDGEPGVYTARYGGAGLSHADRYNLLLANMRAVPRAQRRARFRAVLVLVPPDGTVVGEAAGVCDGVIAPAPAGEGGFG